MKNLLKLGVATILTFTAAGVVNAQETPEKAATAEIGKPAPMFELKNIEGQVVKLEDYKDKVVVLEWFNRDCPVVVFHAGQLKELADHYTEKGVVWLAIDSTYGAAPDRVKEYVEQKELKQPVLFDSDGKVGKAYGARTTPHMFVINKGVLVYSGALDDGGPRQLGSNNYVSAAVDAVLKGETVAVSTTRPYGCTVKYKK